MTKDGVSDLLLWHREPHGFEAGRGTCVFTACDEAYLTHAIALIRSLDLFSPGRDAVLHLVGPSAGALRRVDTLRGLLQHTRLAVSTEQPVPAAWDEETRRTYYACARFLLLPAILAALQRPVLALDADSLVLAPLQEDFNPKPGAELCLVRRDADPATPEHLAVATGSVWIVPSPRTAAFLDAVAADIRAAFAAGEARWFLDQSSFVRQMRAHAHGVTVRSIRPRYADWELRDTALIWAGKGARKWSDRRFVVLQALLSDDPPARARAHRDAAALEAIPDLPPAFRARLQRVVDRARDRVVIYLPRLDLPWECPALAGPMPHLQPDALTLRLHWSAFAAQLANAFESAGTRIDLVELPAWEITPQRLDSDGAALAFIPHRWQGNFDAGGRTVRYYKAAYLPWLFTVDPGGWGAGASAYPVQLDAVQRLHRSAAGEGGFATYRARLSAGTLGSKAAQPAAQPRAALVARGEVPDGPYLFFPLQGPHDQSVACFSAVGEMQVLLALLPWARARGIAVVLKPHPADPPSMEPFRALAQEHGAWWSRTAVDDLIAHSQAVYTINGSVGFDALLRLKPVAVFGRAEYDCVAVRATLDRLDEAYEQVLAPQSNGHRARCEAFFDWFLDRYAVDLSRPDVAQRRLRELAAEAWPLPRQEASGARSPMTERVRATGPVPGDPLADISDRPS